MVPHARLPTKVPENNFAAIAVTSPMHTFFFQTVPFQLEFKITKSSGRSLALRNIFHINPPFPQFQPAAVRIGAAS
jgi:hypothetical protein